MDRRSWPWKKKSSEKAVAATDSSPSTLSISGANQADQGGSKTVNYVQVSAESYAHLTEMEEQVKVLSEKLSEAQTEIINKENLVKQHTKVAEEAVSGWEKVEAEASALKYQLESVTLLKLTAEERASHLDGALKECMKQIRNVKEESEQKLHDVVFARTKQWEKVKAELEERIVSFEQELRKASAENSELSKSLQERSNILIKISDEKMQAEAEIETLKSNAQSCEKEISSLKYELHVVSKELEIRNEEKNMSIRSADVVSKQRLEDVKKISKLEAECQRLRGLVRKKLPGPAALAQMKLEVENMDRDYRENRLRRSPAKISSPHHASTTTSDFAFESIHQFQKENEFLTARLLAMEEETKMLKEALSKRNSELQASRNTCAKTANKLQSMEVQMLNLNQQKTPTRSNFGVPIHNIPSQNGSNPPSLTSMSEDGIDEEGSCSESWATALVSEVSQFKKQKDVEKSSVTDNNHMELMDDFLEMERLACLSNRTTTISDSLVDKMESSKHGATAIGNTKNVELSRKPELSPGKKESSPHSSKNQPELRMSSTNSNPILIRLRSRLDSLMKYFEQEADIGALLEYIRRIVHDTQDELPQHSESCVIEDTHPTGYSWDKKYSNDNTDKARDSDASSKQEIFCLDDVKHVIDNELRMAVNKIHDFISSFIKEAVEVKDMPSKHGVLFEKLEKFSRSTENVLQNESRLYDFVLVLSHVLFEVGEICYSFPSLKGIGGENNASDCIMDKATLSENKLANHDRVKVKLSGSSMLSHPESEGPITDKFGSQDTMQKVSLEEFKQMKLEKEHMEMKLASCTKMLEDTKYQLAQTEQQLEELKSELSSSKKSYGLAETQLKCMAESYNLLETQSKGLQDEVNLLRANLESLNNEIQEERRIHEDHLAKYKDLKEQFERIQKSPHDDADIRTKQEKEIEEASEKLAECQETILLLGKHLQALRPQAEHLNSSSNARYLMKDDVLEDAPGSSGFHHQGMHMSGDTEQSETEGTRTTMRTRSGDVPPFKAYCSQSPSDTEVSSFPRSPVSSKRPKHRSSRSSSSSSFHNVVPEKQHGRGFSRFFSKGKSDN